MGQQSNSPSWAASEPIASVQDSDSESSNAKGDYQSKEVGHDLLAVEELKSRIDDHGNDDPVEESSEDRQSEKDDENRDGSSFDHGLRAISHVPPTGNQSHYDTESADLFLEVLGFGLRDPVILSAGGEAIGVSLGVLVINTTGGRWQHKLQKVVTGLAYSIVEGQA